MINKEGFSLLELAIVLVIIGVIMGAIMQGQKIYYNAKINRVISDLKNYKQFFLTYYDSYLMYPGDENDPNFPSGDTFNGNHNGLIDTNEAENVWEDLYHAMDVVRRNSPFGGKLYIFGNRDFGYGRRNFISVEVPNKVAQVIDNKIDDGSYNTGNVLSSASYDGSETYITLWLKI